MFKDLILKNRSYRKFYEDFFVSKDILKELIDYARLSASAANKQPLRYILVNKAKDNQIVFSKLSWAGYLTNWPGPEEGERPSAYIIMLTDKEISTNCKADAGIACQSILLGAVEKKLGGCILGSVKRNKLADELHISEQYEILYVIAIGKPKEKVVIETTDYTSSIKYWRDEKKIHHVPKRKLTEIILDI